MSKHKYRCTNVKKINQENLTESAQGDKIVVGIDIAKEAMVAAIMNERREVLVTVKWSHPKETPQFVALVQAVEKASDGLETAMEPSGTYGDALRWQLLSAHFKVFRVSPKRSHDMAEVLDGVPSLHDAKSSEIIARLHFDKMSEPWPIKSESERSMAAALRMMGLHGKQFRQNLNRLEALTARHWPELTRTLELSSATLLELLITYGGPEQVAKDLRGARELMRRIGKKYLTEEKIKAVLEGASATAGLPAIPEEVELLRALAAEARRNQKAERAARHRVEKLVGENTTTDRMQSLIGKATSAVVIATAGDPNNYDAPQAFLKSLGLNMRENSSGKKKGGLHITKRGSGVARKYLFMAALRFIQAHPIVAAWYDKKVTRQGGTAKIKAVVAVMRKMVLALWHVARGATFDASKLFDTRRLKLSPTKGA